MPVGQILGRAHEDQADLPSEIQFADLECVAASSDSGTFRCQLEGQARGPGSRSTAGISYQSIRGQDPL